MKDGRYLGGGTLYWKPNKANAVERELAEVQDFTIKPTTEKKEAFSKANVMKTLVAYVVTGFNVTVSFSIQKFDTEVMAMALGGTVSNEVFAVGATLPDMTVATESTTIPVIKVGASPLIEGQLRFVGDEDGDKKPVMLIHNAAITTSGDIAMISEDFAKLAFEGAVLKTDKGYMDEYFMTVGA
jgi:hypothetical protein